MCAFKDIQDCICTINNVEVHFFSLHGVLQFFDFLFFFQKGLEWVRSLGFMRHSEGAGVGGYVGEQRGLKCVCLCLCWCVFFFVYVCVYVYVFLCGGEKQHVFWGGGGLIQFLMAS